MLKKLKDLLKDKLGPGSTAYRIFKPCRRCVYQKSYENILIFSRERGPRIIITSDGRTFVREGPCIGFQQCGKCFEVIEGKEKRKCTWKEF